AAERRFLHFDELETGDGAQQSSWFLSDALRMRQVAGLLVGHRAANRLCRRQELVLAEVLGDVAHARAELSGALGVGGIVLEQVAVLLQRRAAAGGGDDDGVVAGGRE